MSTAPNVRQTNETTVSTQVDPTGTSNPDTDASGAHPVTCACGCGLEARRKYATDQCRFRVYNAKRGRVEYDKARKHRRGSRGGKAKLPRLKEADYPALAAMIDGEAFQTHGLQSAYSLLQIREENGTTYERCTPGRKLTTNECLSLLFETNCKSIYGFSLGYDISNWLTDLSVEHIRTLRAFNQVSWRQWRIFWIPGKMLKVIDFSKPQGSGNRQRIVFDLFPFCQKSFISSLTDWSIDVPDTIRQGKEARGTFTVQDLPFVRDYNLAELELMAVLYRKLGKALDAAGMRPKSWTGPGGVARTVYTLREMSQYRSNPKDTITFPKDIEPKVEDAYFGGRFECSHIGEVEQAYEYDLISAYPHAITEGLPCWAHGHWVSVGEDWLAEPYALVYVRWKPRKKNAKPMWGPFPSRTAERHLCFPASGEGWFHGCEVAAAMSWLSEHYTFKTSKAVAWQQSCDCVPWSWVGELADERARIKHEQPGKAQAIKLCLNSLYGILADSAGLGEKPDPAGYVGYVKGSDTPRISRTRDRFSAGLITARTRARLLEAIGKGWEDVVYIATDGIHSRSPISLALGARLGDWEEPKVSPDRAIFLLGGCYAYASREVTKVRGVRGARAYTFAQLQLWHAAGKITLDTGSKFCGCYAAAHHARYREEPYRARLNQWYVDVRDQPLDLRPRRQKRDDGRWVAIDDASSATIYNLIHQAQMEQDRQETDAYEATDWSE